MAVDGPLPAYFLARDSYARSFGDVDPELLAPMVNPGLVGGPIWPGLRESWRRIRRGSTTIALSDGLSDPSDEDPSLGVGLGVEVLVESPDQFGEPFAGSWLFQLAYDISQQAASSCVFRELRDDLVLFSSELKARGALKSFASSNGHIGVLLGVPAPGLDLEWVLPAGVVRVVTATLLHPSELAVVVADGPEGRARICKALVDQGNHHLSSLHRKAVA